MRGRLAAHQAAREVETFVGLRGRRVDAAERHPADVRDAVADAAADAADDGAGRGRDTRAAGPRRRQVPPAAGQAGAAPGAGDGGAVRPVTVVRKAPPTDRSIASQDLTCGWPPTPHYRISLLIKIKQRR